MGCLFWERNEGEYIMESKKKGYLKTILLLRVLTCLAYTLNFVGASLLLQSITTATTILTAIYRVEKSIKLPTLKFLPMKLTVTLESSETKITTSIELSKKGFERRSRRLFFMDNPIRCLFS